MGGRRDRNTDRQRDRHTDRNTDVDVEILQGRETRGRRRGNKRLNVSHLQGHCIKARHPSSLHLEESTSHFSMRRRDSQGLRKKWCE